MSADVIVVSGLVERDGRRWLCPVGAPQSHPWMVPADWDELICSLCVEDEKCCECDIPDLITLIEHKTRVWARQSTPAPPVDVAAAPALPAPDEHHPDGGAPIWNTDDGTVTAYPQGIELDGYLHEDVDGLERTALAVLAAVQAVRGMKP